MAKTESKIKTLYKLQYDYFINLFLMKDKATIALMIKKFFLKICDQLL